MLESIQQQSSECSTFSVLGLSQQIGLPPSYPYSGVWMRYVPHQNMLPHPEDLMTELSFAALSNRHLEPFLLSRTPVPNDGRQSK